jgi:hypothetical protein
VYHVCFASRAVRSPGSVHIFMSFGAWSSY